MADTRRALIEAATKTFAEDGVFTASLVEVTRRAGQRNRGAVHYHFGSREELLVAVLEQQATFLARREGELLELARAAPDDDVAAALEAVIRPAVELAETGAAGRDYLIIVGHLVEQYDQLGPAVVDALRRTGGHAVYELIEQRMPDLDDGLCTERLTLVTGFILRAVADRARQPSSPGRPQLPTEQFVGNLLAMTAAMLCAPPVAGR
ncbi:MAG: TetR family transcriptional regulator [Nocardioides sp.]